MVLENLDLDQKKVLFVDITIFDRKEIASQSSYKNPLMVSKGLKHVLVDGLESYSEQIGLIRKI